MHRLVPKARSNDKAAIELDEEVKRIESTGREDVLHEITSQGTYDGEQKNALSKAIDRAFEFLTGGGKVDVHVDEPETEAEGEEGSEGAPPDDKTLKAIKEIKDAFTEIKELESKILALPDNSES